MRGGLFQVLPGIIRKVNDELEADCDFWESLRLYLDNFDHVVIACAVESDVSAAALRRCRPIRELSGHGRLRILPLPNANQWRRYLRHYQQVRELLKHEIEQADYLLFSAYALIGDWAIVATHEAVKLRRKYGLDADVVYDKRAELSWDRPEERFRLAKLKLLLPLFRRMYRYCLEHSALALLQGQDVYDAYAPFCRNPHKVYHMPVSEEDYITNAQMQQKLSLLSEARPLRLCYVGRCIEIKGPWDWLRVLHGLMANKVEFRAEWLGDGSLLPKMRAMAAELGVADYVQFQGYVGRRDDILETLRSADMFLFCHKTPESPRCLVEALVSGCPLVGYGSAYPRDLVAEHGGGDFVEIGDCQGLVEKVKRLNDNRQKIRALIKAAGDSGRLFERDATMQRRIDLIVRYLGADGT